MTYSKLKELGYGHDDWKDLTQEQANELVAKGRKETTNRETSKGETSKTGSNSIQKENTQKSNNTPWSEIEEDDFAEINGKTYLILSKNNTGVVAREYPDGYKNETFSKREFTDKK